MAMSSSSAGADEPMMDINTTPLIDVMLVLLIMFIITLPPPTHAVKIDLPQDCAPNCPPPPPIKPTKNVVYIAPNAAVLWNGQPVELSVLKDLLERTQTMDPVPELHFQPDPQAPYDKVHTVLKITKIANVSKMGFIGNEAYRAF
jgi:biopolymer transport protein ExbD